MVNAPLTDPLTAMRGRSQIKLGFSIFNFQFSIFNFGMVGVHAVLGRLSLKVIFLLGKNESSEYGFTFSY